MNKGFMKWYFDNVMDCMLFIETYFGPVQTVKDVMNFVYHVKG